MSKPELHAWFDCETTGDPTNFVIEVAIVVTDSNLTILNSMTGTIALPDNFNPNVHCVPVVNEMHEVNGLWDDLENPTWFNYSQCDDHMYTFLANVMDQYADNYERNVGEPLPEDFNYKYRLAGSGVSHYDSHFLKQYFPLMWMGLDGFNDFSKPSLDIGVMRRFFQQVCKTDDWAPPVSPEGTYNPHRALDDVISFIYDAKWYRDQFIRIRPEKDRES